MQPYPRAHAAWPAYGSEAVAFTVDLRVVWRHHMDLNDLPVEACKVEGILLASSA